MNSRQLQLQSKAALKREETKLIEQQVRLLNQEVEIRRNMVKQLFEKFKTLQDERQDIADQLLEMEYKALVAAGV